MRLLKSSKAKKVKKNPLEASFRANDYTNQCGNLILI